MVFLTVEEQSPQTLEAKLLLPIGEAQSPLWFKIVGFIQVQQTSPFHISGPLSFPINVLIFTEKKCVKI